METKKPIALLTAYSAISAAIIAAFVVIGFMVQVRLTQLLGIDLPDAPTDYLAAAGDFLLSLVVRSFSALLFRDFTLTRTHLVILVAASLAIVLGLIIRRAALDSAWRTHAARLSYVLIIIGGSALLLLTMSLLRLRNVLQPANDTHLVQRLQKVDTPDVSAAQRLVIAAYKHASSTLQDPVATASFNPSSGNTAEYRQNAYAATIMVAALLIAALSAPPKDAAPAFRRLALIAAWMAVLLSLPLAYATLGRNFTYPVVRVTSTGPPAISYCGYLLATDASSVTIYDRPSGFRLRRIPRDHLLIDQLGTASPFQGCGSVRSDPEGFIPCETQFCP